MSAQALTSNPFNRGNSSDSSSDDGCHFACSESLPLFSSVNDTNKGLVPDYQLLMPTISRPLQLTTQVDHELAQEALVLNGAASTMIGATPPDNVADNAYLFIEVIPAPHVPLIILDSMRLFEAHLPGWGNEQELHRQALAQLFSLIGRSCRCPRTMELTPLRCYALDFDEYNRYPCFPHLAGADSTDPSFWNQPFDVMDHSLAHRRRAVVDDNNTFIQSDTNIEVQQEGVYWQSLLRADLAASCVFDCDTVQVTACWFFVSHDNYGYSFV